MFYVVVYSGAGKENDKVREKGTSVRVEVRFKYCILLKCKPFTCISIYHRQGGRNILTHISLKLYCHQLEKRYIHVHMFVCIIVLYGAAKLNQCVHVQLMCHYTCVLFSDERQSPTKTNTASCEPSHGKGIHC